MQKVIYFFILIFSGMGLFLFFTSNNNLSLSDIPKTASQEDVVAEKKIPKIEKPIDPKADIEPQKKLENPPSVIKAIYSTAWSASSAKKIDYFINLIKTTEINAIVVDIKDYTGNLSYKNDIELVNKYGAVEIKILKPNALIKKFHDEGIYVIARMAVFQDPALVKARPDLALQSISKNTVWKDYKGISWVDTSSKEVWDYNITIAKDALSRGFDEINFDYIRFASDGNMADIRYPFYNAKIQTKRQVMHSFFKYLRENLPGAKLSADLFGYTTLLQDDLGIGQNIDDAMPYFDYIAPMVYPSHYNKGFNGHTNPAEFPYDVVYTSMLKAEQRLDAFNKSTTTIKMVESKFRPWLQDFDLGADYDAVKIRAQIQATYDAASTTEAGWMLWAPTNIYTKAGLLLDEQ
ncbi:MAG: putative glycoside hydrolase [Patescibacteria group bacterium]